MVSKVKSNASRLHKETFEVLEKMFPMIDIIQEHSIKVGNENRRDKTLYLDFYIPSFGIAIECQGEQHFKSNSHFFDEKGFENQKKNDKLKKEWCSDNGVSLVEITFKEKVTAELIQQKISEAINE